MAENFEQNPGFASVFKGNAASTFCELVEVLGFKKTTYPYIPKSEDKVDKPVVLKAWRGPNYK